MFFNTTPTSSKSTDRYLKGKAFPSLPIFPFFFFFFRIFNTTRILTSSKSTDRYLKGKTFPSFFPSFLFIFYPHVGRERSFAQPIVGENSNHSAPLLYRPFIPLLTRLAGDASVGTHSRPGSKIILIPSYRVAALSTNVKSASGVSSRWQEGEGEEKIGWLETNSRRGMSGQYLLWSSSSLQVERFCPGNRLKLRPTNNTGKTRERERERGLTTELWQESTKSINCRRNYRW